MLEVVENDKNLLYAFGTVLALSLTVLACVAATVPAKSKNYRDVQEQRGTADDDIEDHDVPHVGAIEDEEETAPTRPAPSTTTLSLLKQQKSWMRAGVTISVVEVILLLVMVLGGNVRGGPMWWSITKTSIAGKNTETTLRWNLRGREEQSEASRYVFHTYWELSQELTQLEIASVYNGSRRNFKKQNGSVYLQHQHLATGDGHEVAGADYTGPHTDVRSDAASSLVEVEAVHGSENHDEDARDREGEGDAADDEKNLDPVSRGAPDDETKLQQVVNATTTNSSSSFADHVRKSAAHDHHRSDRPDQPQQQLLQREERTRGRIAAARPGTMKIGALSGEGRSGVEAYNTQGRSSHKKNKSGHHGKRHHHDHVHTSSDTSHPGAGTILSQVAIPAAADFVTADVRRHFDEFFLHSSASAAGSSSAGPAIEIGAATSHVPRLAFGGSAAFSSRTAAQGGTTADGYSSLFGGSNFGLPFGSSSSTSGSASGSSTTTTTFSTNSSTSVVSDQVSLDAWRTFHYNCHVAGWRASLYLYTCIVVRLCGLLFTVLRLQQLKMQHTAAVMDEQENEEDLFPKAVVEARRPQALQNTSTGTTLEENPTGQLVPQVFHPLSLTARTTETSTTISSLFGTRNRRTSKATLKNVAVCSCVAGFWPLLIITVFDFTDRCPNHFPDPRASAVGGPGLWYALCMVFTSSLWVVLHWLVPAVQVGTGSGK
ncbi:unnamed protein product [Amoebophrya sp. A120]|nr:unnamed protein product [Amoebophrya sp. A120]|eukprot:GSA120T00023297001.1